MFDLLRFVEEESMLVNDPLFSKEGINFFAEIGLGGRRSEIRAGGRREKNFKKGKHSVNSYATGIYLILHMIGKKKLLWLFRTKNKGT